MSRRTSWLVCPRVGSFSAPVAILDREALLVRRPLCDTACISGKNQIHMYMIVQCRQTTHINEPGSLDSRGSWGKGGLVYFACACAKLFVYLSILHTKFHIQIVNKRKMYTEEKYVRPGLWCCLRCRIIVQTGCCFF